MDPYVIQRNAGDARVGDPGFLPKAARRLRHAGHAFAVVPFIGGVLGAPFVMAGYGAEILDSLIDGKALKAAKQGIMGGVDTAVTTFAGSGLIGGLAVWAADPISLMATGKTTGEFARTATASVLDAPEAIAKRSAYKKSVKQMQLGQPQFSNVAAMGYAPAMMNAQAQQQDTSGYWFDKAANERGVDPATAYKQFANGNTEHMAQLEDARSRQTEQQLAH